MKILQINKYHFIRGGSDSVYLNTSRLLRENGHEVVNFAMQFEENNFSSYADHFADNKDFTRQSTVQKLINTPSFFYNFNAAKKLETLLKEEKPDIAHLHIFYGSLTSSILKVLKAYKIPIVVSVHDYKFICPSYLLLNGKNEICEKCQGKKYYNTVANKCVKNSKIYSLTFAMEAYFRDVLFPLHRWFDRLIFVSKFSADIHIKYKPELKRIASHLYNFDPVLLSKKNNNIRGSYFLYAGRLSKEKGVKSLIDAFKYIPEHNLKIAGTGEELLELKCIAPSNVEFLGHQKGHDLQSIIEKASFIIVPSEWYENNPMAIIEAYSLGKPVIASAIGGIPEIVSEADTGFLFKHADVEDLKRAIVKAAEITEEVYRQMSINAIKFANENFHPEVHYRKLIGIYTSLLNQ